METNEVSELFPLFNATNAEILEWLLSVAQESSYSQNSTIIAENDWGKSVEFIVAGWVKLQSCQGENDLTLEICSRGDYLGDMAILDESLRNAQAIALSEVKILSVSAQRFIQMLFKDPQLHHRALQLTVKRLRRCYRRVQFQTQPPQLKLVKTLTTLASAYGQSTEKGVDIFNIPCPDLANLANISAEEAQQLMIKLQSKGWIEIDSTHQTLSLTNPKHLHHFIHQL